MLPTKQDLLDTQERIKNFIHNTPVLSSESVNQMANAQLFFKCDNLQKMGAFKMRGASNAISQMSDEQKAKGVATHSSGNFAQAVSLSAKLMGIKAYIVMPENAPAVKKAAVREYGGEIIECPSTQEDREATLATVVERTGATFVHPYNDHKVICGQATAAMELLKQQTDLDIIMAPVGGGGLISGSALACHYFAPQCRVISAEPENADDAFRSKRDGQIYPSVKPDTIADGLRTSLGDKTYPIVKDLVEEIILVSESEIAAAMRIIWERMKLVVEASAAVPLAAVLKRPETFGGKKVGIILSGGNVDLSKLPFK